MNKKERYKKYEISGIIADYFLAQLQVPTAMLFYPRSEIYKLFRSNDVGDRRRVMRVLTKMKLDNFIRIYGTEDGTRIQITPFGRKQLTKLNFDRLSLPKSKKWDGKWRVVMFDIPESKKKARDALSLKLKRLGFQTMQKSVFIYPFDCRKEIEFTRDYFGLGSCINYIIAEKIEGEKLFRKKFSL